MWHAGLLAKIQAAGVSGNAHAWFTDYLSDRKQRVVLPGAVSDCTCNSCWSSPGIDIRPSSVSENIYTAICICLFLYVIMRVRMVVIPRKCNDVCMKVG